MSHRVEVRLYRGGETWSLYFDFLPRVGEVLEQSADFWGPGSCKSVKRTFEVLSVRHNMGDGSALITVDEARR